MLCIPIAVAVLLCLPMCARSQERFRVEHLTTEQGLSQSLVYSIFQDSRGFVWLGTRDGLNRFDGYEFLLFKHHPFDSASLSGIVASLIAEDSFGNIWAWSYAGMNRLDRHTLRFERFAAFSTARGSTTTGYPLATIGDSRGRLWVGTSQALMYFDGASRRIVRADVDLSGGGRLEGTPFFAFYRDRSGRLWANAGSHLCRIDEVTGRVHAFPTPERLVAGSKILGEDDAGRLLLGTSAELRGSVIAWYDPAVGAFSDIKQSIELTAAQGRTELVTPCAAYDGLLWFFTSGEGLNRGRGALFAVPLDTIARRPIAQRELKRWCYLDGVQVLSFMRDRSGAIWVGTDQGAYRITIHGERFVTFRERTVQRDGLSCERVRGLIRDRGGELWVGTDFGLNRYNERTGEWRSYTWFLPERLQQQNTVNAVYEDTDGALLIGTNGGAARVDRHRTRFTRLAITGPGERHIENGSVRCFLRDASGNLWVGTRDDGVALFDRAGRFVRRFRGDPDDTTAIHKAVVWFIYQDRARAIWIGTSSGLCRWEPETQRFRRYLHRADDSTSLSGDNVCAAAESGDGVLWFAIHGGGVCRYDRERDRFSTITTNNGLPSNSVYAVLPDSRGRLWLSSNDGLIRFDPATGASRVFTAGDGIQSNEFTFGSYFGSGDGSILFGGMRGFTAVNPDGAHDNTVPPKIVVTAFRVFDRTRRSELRDGDTLRVKYDENFIAFEFAALDYVNPAVNRYAYMLEGFDAGWINCGTRRYASFTNLDPGTYRFLVNGSNNDGVWASAPLGIVVEVIPPFWMTWWFRACAGLLVVLALGAVVIARLRVVRLRERLRRQQVESELKALRLQMNPHFIFNALGSIQHLIIKREDRRATEYLAKFARLVRATLENSRRTFISVREETDHLRLYLMLESLRFDSHFTYTIEIDPDIDADRTQIPTMLLQPLVENAIRHGLLSKQGGGSVMVRLELRGPVLFCVVEDDGVGRVRAGELAGRSRRGRSLGLDVTRERLKMLRSTSGQNIEMRLIDLYTPDRVPAGTRVEISIPIEPISP